MSEDIDYHDFEEDDACDVCGESESADEHDSDNEDDFDHDYEQVSECAHCGMDEGSEEHQEDED